jgi:adenylate cyclase
VRLLPEKLKKGLSRHGVRWLFGAAMTVVAILQVSGDLPLTAVERMDGYFTGLWMRIHKPVLDERIVIVDIDDRSIAQVGRFPWSRDIMAELTRRMTTEYGTAAIGFDITFPEADTSSGYGVLEKLADKQLKGVPGFREKLAGLKDELDYDGLLVKQFEGMPVVLGYSISDEKPRGMLPPPAFTKDTLNGRTVPARGAASYVGNLPRLQEVAAGAGIFSAIPDVDGILRSSPLLMQIGDGYYPTLSLATVAVALDAMAIAPRFNGAVDELTERQKANGGLDAIDLIYKEDGKRKRKHMLVGENLKVMIEFRGTGGPRGGAFTYVSAVDVLNGKVDKKVLEGAIALVGTTAAGLNDLRATPVNSEYPGVEVHANLMKSIIDESFKHRPDYADAVDAVAVGLVGATLSIVLMLLTPLWAILLAAAAIAGVLGFNYYMYATHDLVFNVAGLVLLVAGLFVFNLAWGYFFEFRKGKALVSRFGEYVAPELVAEMAENPDKYNMDGESRELTVLFVDVRGFTTISEGLTPKALREYINIYLTAMSSDIRDLHRGTLDKYIGDAVMAFWGAPVAFADHASRAVATSLAMQVSAHRLNDEFVARGWPPLKIGIGLNSGLMHVGDMGSAIRRAYTVMGDAVNLGSRLEGITKVYGVGITVGETTRAAAPEFIYRELDLVRVKGKNEPVAIFEPVGKAGEVAADAVAEIGQWEAALALVRSQQWDAAEAALHALQQAQPERGLYALYIERIAYYRAHPPGEGWDGVTTFETK